MTVAGWKPPWDAIHTMIENKWLTEEQAVRWHQGKAVVKETTPSSQAISESEHRDAQEARQLLDKLT